MAIHIPKKFDDSRIPVGLRTPLKTPFYGLGNWGIRFGGLEDFYELVDLSELGYREEWDLTTEQGDRDIAKAAEMAGYGNTRLNPENARIISYIINNFLEGKVNILDVGAGAGGTSIPIWNALNDKDKDRVYFTLLDPAEKKLETAESKLNELGLRIGKEYDIINATDLEIPNVIEEGSQHIVTSVASQHHHGYLTKPFENSHNATKRGGYFVVSDWHNSMWDHPAKVYYMLQQFYWPTKEEDLKEFVKCYPKALDPTIEFSSDPYRKENQQIIDFWKCYAMVRTTEENQFFILEGHRPVERYMEEMQKVGYDLNSPNIIRMISNGTLEKNPYALLRTQNVYFQDVPASKLHMLTVAQRPI